MPLFWCVDKIVFSWDSIFKDFSVPKMTYSSATVGQIRFLLAFLFTAVNTLSIISPPQHVSETFTVSPLVNTTDLDLSIDSRFDYKAEFGETTLPLTPCLMNTVELLAQYAELDWLSQVRPRHGAVLPQYPQVEIAVLPAAPATSVEVRLVILGIWVGIRAIIKGNNYHEAEFEILWEGKLKAYIYFTLPVDLRVTSSNATSETEESLKLLLPSLNKTVGDTLDTSSSAQDSPDALYDGHFSWRPMFAPTARTLTVVEVFLTVMAGLKCAASHVASDKVSGPYAASAADVNANVQLYIYRRRTPRVKPPFFQYIHVIKALRLIPAYMLEKKRFSELLFAVDVDGLQVGAGYLERGHYNPPGFVLGDVLASKDNVSLS